MWVQQQPLYLLKYSLIFLDVACDEAAKTASRKAPNGNLPRPLPRRGAQAISVLLGTKMNLFIS